MSSAPRTSCCGLLALGLALSSLAANCQEQLEATFPADDAEAAPAADAGPVDGVAADARQPDAPPGDAALDDGSALHDAGMAADAAGQPDASTFDAGADADGPVDAAPGVDRGSTYHPPGWALPDNHGSALEEQQQDCRACHGQDLTGTAMAPSCDSCHSAIDPNWRTNCTFCHGGGDNQSGAPPLDLGDSSDTALLTVGAHTEHVTETTHPAYDCSECHLKPLDVLSAGHVFDSTPGVAEVIFDSTADALSAAGSFSAPGCSALYCHGYRRLDNGTAGDFTGSVDRCDACHPSASSGADAWEQRMSGRHKMHLTDNPESGGMIRCWECHRTVVDANNQIIDPSLHVNGVANVALPNGTFTPGNPSTCSVSCHGEGHSNDRW